MEQMAKYHCSKCNHFLFSGENSWSPFSKTYITTSPQVAASLQTLPVDLLVGDKPKVGTNELQDCNLLSLFCKSCSQRLGLKCLNAPTNRAQYSGKIFLKASKLIPYESGFPAEFSFVQIPSSNPSFLDATSPRRKNSMPFDDSNTVQEGSASSAPPENFARSNDATSRLQLLVTEQQATIECLRTAVLDLQHELEKLKNRVVVLEGSGRNGISTTPQSETVFPQPLKKARRTGTHGIQLHSRDVSAPSIVSPVADGTIILARDDDDVRMRDFEPQIEVPASNEPLSRSQTTTQEYLKNVPVEDPDDIDYEPPVDPSQSQLRYEPLTQEVAGSAERLLTPARPTEPIISPKKSGGRGGKRENAGRPRKNNSESPPPSLGTPEWEKDDWDPDEYVNAGGRQGIMRRGVSGRMVPPTSKRPKIDTSERPRDAEGYLLMPDGRRDGRSVRRGRRSHFGVGGGRSSTEGGNNTSGDDERHKKIMSQIFPGRYKQA